MSKRRFSRVSEQHIVARWCAAGPTRAARGVYALFLARAALQYAARRLHSKPAREAATALSDQVMAALHAGDAE